MGRPFSKGEVNELAEVFGVSLAARHLLIAAGLSRSKVPLPDGDALTFWMQVGALVSDGVLEDGRLRIMAEALERYPANPVFQVGVTDGPVRRAPDSLETESGAHDEALPYTIVALDACAYSKQALPTHLDWRAATRRFVAAALQRSRIGTSDIVVQDTGDGVLLGFGPAISKRIILADFLKLLRDEIRVYNRGREQAARLRVRASMHHGETVVQWDGFAGDPAVVAARLVDAKPTRDVLESMPEADLAVIVSDETYRETVDRDLYGLDRRDYRREVVTVPKFDGVGWLHVPGFDLATVPVSRPATAPVEAPRVASPSVFDSTSTVSTNGASPASGTAAG